MKNIPNFYKKIIALAFFTAILSIACLSSYAYADYFSWTWSPSSQVRDWSSVAIADDSTMYAVESALSTYVYKSTNGGVNWTEAGNVLDYVLLGEIETATNGIIYITTRDNNRIYKSTNHGVSWSNFGTPNNATNIKLAVSDDGNILVAAESDIDENRGVFISTDEGSNWVRRLIFTNNNVATSVVCDSGCNNIYVSTFGGTLLRSSDFGGNWSTVSVGSISSLDTSDDGSLVVGVGGGLSSILVSTDYGQTWSTRGNNIYGNSVDITPDGSTIVVSNSAGVIYLSTDRGLTWTQEHDFGHSITSPSIAISNNAGVTILGSSNAYIQLGVDDVGPVLVSAIPEVSGGADQYFNVGDIITFNVTMNEPVSTNGIGMIPLQLIDPHPNSNLTANCSQIVIAPQDATSTFTCSYIVGSEDNSIYPIVLRPVNGVFNDRLGNSMTIFSDTGTGSYNIYFDTTTLFPSDIDLTNDTDNGISYTDNITSEASPDFNVTCSDLNDDIKIYNAADDTVIGQGTCASASESVVSISTSNLSDGDYTLYATEIDKAGNESPRSGAPTISITIDITDPSAPGTPDLRQSYDTGTSTTDNITYDTGLTIDVSCQVGNTVTLRDDGSIIDTVGCNPYNNTATISSTFTPGTHIFDAIQTDVAGNVSEPSEPLTVVIDTTAPVVSNGSSLGTINDATPDYVFTSDEVGAITYDGDCTSDTATATIGDNTVTFHTLSEGEHSNCAISVTDTAGNSSDSLNVPAFTIDITPPSGFVIVSPVENSTIEEGFVISYSLEEHLSTGTIVITRTGGVLDGNSPHLCALTGLFLEQGNHSVSLGTDCDGGSINLSPGAIYTFDFTWADNVGNEALQSILNVTFSGDTVAPIISEITPVPSSTNNINPPYTFESDEAGTITYGGSCISETTDASSGQNTIYFSSLSDAVYADCTITITDQFDNVSNVLSVTQFIVDTIPFDAPDTEPNLTDSSDTGSSNSDNITSDDTPTFVGSCPDGATVRLYSNNYGEGVNEIGSYTCSAETSYTVTSVQLENGQHTITSTFADYAGNISGYSPEIIVTIDNTAPSINFTFPSGSATLNSTPTLSVNASDDSGVAGVQFYYASTTILTAIGNEVTQEPFSVEWNTNGVDDGQYTLYAVARDTLNNRATTSIMNIGIDNTAPDAPNTALDLDTGSDTGISDSDNITNLRDIGFNVPCISGLIVSLYDEMGSLQGLSSYCSNDDSVTLTTQSSYFSEGNHIVYYSYNDAVGGGGGNESGLSPGLAFTVDATSPAISSATVDGRHLTITFNESIVENTPNLYNYLVHRFVGWGYSGEYPQAADPTVSGSTVTLTLNTPALSDDIFSFDYSNTYENYTTDYAGNNLVDITDVQVVNLMPTSAPASFIANATTSAINLSWVNPTESDFHSVTLRRGTGDYPSTVSDGDAVFIDSTDTSYEDSNLSDGTYYYSLFARDTTGNYSIPAHASGTIGTLSDTNSSSGFSTTQIITGFGGGSVSTSNQFYSSNIYTSIKSTSTSLFNIATSTRGIDMVLNATSTTAYNLPVNVNNLNGGLNSQKKVFVMPDGKPFVFNKNITVGVVENPKDSDIKKLQIFLNSIGYTVSTIGPGSLGNETSKFGPATKAALIKFQKAIGIKGANGVFGPATRTYVNGILKSLVK